MISGDCLENNRREFDVEFVPNYIWILSYMCHTTDVLFILKFPLSHVSETKSLNFSDTSLGNTMSDTIK